MCSLGYFSTKISFKSWGSNGNMFRDKYLIIFFMGMWIWILLWSTTLVTQFIYTFDCILDLSYCTCSDSLFISGKAKRAGYHSLLLFSRTREILKISVLSRLYCIIHIAVINSKARSRRARGKWPLSVRAPHVSKKDIFKPFSFLMKTASDLVF